MTAEHKLIDQNEQAISHLTIGVRDLDQALDLWVKTFGFEALRRREGPDADLARVWELKAERILRQAFIGTPGVSAGRLHLVQFADPLPPVRQGAAPTDLVPKNLDLFCRDLPKRYEELSRAGHGFRSPWVQYRTEGLDVREVQMPAPDDVNIVLLELSGEMPPFTPAGYAGVTNFVSAVPDPDAEAKFYREVMGLPLLTDHVLKGPEIEQMVGLASGAAIQIRILGPQKSRFGRVEIVHYQGAKSANRYPLARPPALGLLHSNYVMASATLPELRRRAHAAGVKMIEHGLVKTIFGNGIAYSLHSPAGLRIEIHERSSRAEAGGKQSSRVRAR